MNGKAKVAPSRKNLFSVMNNAGFGDVEIIKSGLAIHVPQDAITGQGRIRTRAGKMIENPGVLTIAQAVELQEKYGISVMRA